MDISLTSLDSFAELPNPLVAISRLRKRARLNEEEPAPEDDAPAPAPEDELLEPPRKPVYRVLGLPDTNEALLTLGPPQPITECVFCPYMGERNFGCMYVEDFNEIIEYMRQNAARMKKVILATEVAARYEKLRAETNAHLLPGQEPWPEMTSATVYDHLDNHHTDAQLTMVKDIRVSNQMADIAANASVIQNIHDDSVKLDEKQAKLYMELKKFVYQIQGKDPKQMVTYSDGAYVEPKTQKAGPLHLSGRNLITRYMH